MEINKIHFDDETSIWKTKLNLKKFKNDFLIECYEEIGLQDDVKCDAYPYSYQIINGFDNVNWKHSFVKEIQITKKTDFILQNGINYSEYLYRNVFGDWDFINSDCWVNRVRSINPVQTDFFTDNRDEQFHTHTDINDKVNSFRPYYTWVYYIQMPNKLRSNTDDGLIYFKSKKGVEYSILPEEDDLIIIPGDMPHSPKNAPNSNIDRIVLAGNIGFEVTKKQKTLF